MLANQPVAAVFTQVDEIGHSPPGAGKDDYVGSTAVMLRLHPFDVQAWIAGERQELIPSSKGEFEYN
jgi:hypothetical protein